MSEEAAAGETPATPEAPVAGSTPAPAAEGITVSVFDGAAPEAKPAEGAAAPEGEAKPWWQTVAGGKYKDEAEAVKGFGEVYGLANTRGKEAKEAAEKATALEERLKGIEPMFGAPVGEDGKEAPYDLKLPEGATLDETARKGWEAFLREKNFSNAMAQEAFERVIVPLEAGRELGQREYERSRVVETLGGDAKDEAVATAAATEAFKWAAGLLGEDAEGIEDLRECGGVGAAILTLARLRTRLSSVNMGSSLGGGVQVLDKAGYEAILREPNSMNDPAKVALVSEYLSRTSGTA